MRNYSYEYTSQQLTNLASDRVEQKYFLSNRIEALRRLHSTLFSVFGDTPIISHIDMVINDLDVLYGAMDTCETLEQQKPTQEIIESKKCVTDFLSMILNKDITVNIDKSNSKLK